jgi:hypothetical protein
MFICHFDVFGCRTSTSSQRTVVNNFTLAPTTYRTSVSIIRLFRSPVFWLCRWGSWDAANSRYRSCRTTSEPLAKPQDSPPSMQYIIFLIIRNFGSSRCSSEIRCTVQVSSYIEKANCAVKKFQDRRPGKQLQRGNFPSLSPSFCFKVLFLGFLY